MHHLLSTNALLDDWLPQPPNWLRPREETLSCGVKMDPIIIPQMTQVVADSEDGQTQGIRSGILNRTR